MCLQSLDKADTATLEQTNAFFQLCGDNLLRDYGITIHQGLVRLMGGSNLRGMRSFSHERAISSVEIKAMTRRTTGDEALVSLHLPFFGLARLGSCWGKTDELAQASS